MSGNLQVLFKKRRKEERKGKRNQKEEGGKNDEKGQKKRSNANRLKVNFDNFSRCVFCKTGNAVLLSDTRNVAVAWSAHGPFEFFSDVLIAKPGPNYIRVTWFQGTVNSEVLLWITDPDGTNPRCLHTDNLSLQVTRVAPKVSWTNLAPAPNSVNFAAEAPSVGFAPYFSDAQQWQLGDTTIFCGGFSATAGANSPHCATWSEGESAWVWNGTNAFSPRLSLGITFVDAKQKILYCFGGISRTAGVATVQSVLWMANFDPVTASVGAWTQVATTGGGPGPRAGAAFWQARFFLKWLFSFVRCFFLRSR